MEMRSVVAARSVSASTAFHCVQNRVRSSISEASTVCKAQRSLASAILPKAGKLKPARDFHLHRGVGGLIWPSYAATHVPLALCGYATTSSVLAIVWSLVRSTVSLTPLLASTGKRLIEGGSER